MNSFSFTQWYFNLPLCGSISEYKKRKRSAVSCQAPPPVLSSVPSLSLHTCTLGQDGYQSLSQPLFSLLLSHPFVNPWQLFEASLAVSTYHLNYTTRQAIGDEHRCVQVNEWGTDGVKDHTPLRVGHSPEILQPQCLKNNKNEREKDNMFTNENSFPFPPDVLFFSYT